MLRVLKGETSAVDDQECCGWSARACAWRSPDSRMEILQGMEGSKLLDRCHGGADKPMPSLWWKRWKDSYIIIFYWVSDWLSGLQTAALESEQWQELYLPW